MELPKIDRNEQSRIDSNTTALIIIDMTNDFMPGGALPVPRIEETVVPITKLATEFALSAPTKPKPNIFFVNDHHTPDDPEFAIWPKHAVGGSNGAMVIPALDSFLSHAELVRKLKYDGFFDTPLDSLLRQRGIKTLVLVGTVSNICILATASSACLRGYKVIIPEDCVSSLDEFGHLILLNQVQYIFQGTIVAKGSDIYLEDGAI